MYVFKIMHWFVFMKPILNMHLAIIGVLIYFIRYYIEVKFKVNNLIKRNRITKMFYYLGIGIFSVGILFKVMHWPFASMNILVGCFSVLLSFFIVFFVDEDINDKQSNPDILDDI